MFFSDDSISSADTATHPVIWIDATGPACGRHLWGMNLVERQIRELARLEIPRVTVWVSAASAEEVRRMRPDLERLYSVELIFNQIAASESLSQYLRKTAGALLLLAGDVVYDERILDYLLREEAGTGVRSAAGETILYLTAEQARGLGEIGGEDGPLAAAESRLEDLGVRTCRPEELEHYVPSLRLTMAPLMLRVPAAGDIRQIDYLMYRRTFKGVIDAVARYGYYHLVRWITRRLSATELTPNLFTVLSILSIWGAIPLFANGWFGVGALVAWAGVILDSVDGKLARLRLHLSDTMGDIEHIAAMPGLGLWYVAVGWHLSGGELVGGSSAALITWMLVICFLLDKIVTGGFKSLYGKELFDYRYLDAVFHLVAARRNVSLFLLTLGAPGGNWGVERAFEAMAGWTVATLLFHVARFVWIGSTRKPEEIRETKGDS